MSHTTEQTDFDELSDMTITRRFEDIFENDRFPLMTKLKKRLTTLKWVGVILIALSCSVPGIVFLNDTGSHNSDAQPQKLNKTVCRYIKQYDLLDSTYITVCNRDGEVFSDLRQIINNTSIITGIKLSLKQWQKLKQLAPLIDTAMYEARTYWKDLKTLVN